MAISLIDLAGADDRIRFSPYCWRTKMALAHKGLAFTTVPWRFTDREALAASGSKRVPVINDGGRWVADSWKIALHLDAAYPDRPALMQDESGRSAARLVQAGCDTILLPAMRPLAVLAAYRLIAEKDKAYFRASREAAFGTTLENYCADETGARNGLKAALAPAEQTLSEFAFLSGGAPGYADYVLFGSLMWPHTVCTRAVLDAESAIGRWFERCLDLHGGLARSAPTARG